jgi:hypothetical protein
VTHPFSRIKSNEIEIELQHKEPLLRVDGFFTFEKRTKEGLLLESKVVPNAILNNGLNLYAQGLANFDSGFVQLGTSDAPINLSSPNMASTPVSSNTAVAASNIQGGSPSFWAGRSITRRFNVGTLNGIYQEVGFGFSAVDNLFSRAILIPALTVAASEVLDVSYTVRLWPALSDLIYSVNIVGVGSRVVTTRASSAGTDAWIPNVGLALGGVEAQAFSGGISASIGGLPSILMAACSSTVQPAYVMGSFSRSRTHQWDKAIAVGNVHSIRTFGNSALNRCGAWQHQFDAPISKSSGVNLFLNFVSSIGRK